ncbi:MAG: hypothetical protein Q7S87_03410 [Agitococcus sp.]|nr:hypothetical protein [Agitococcus sp.]MDO9178685.1 hypothetical protein [Agitococcus sp.]
MTTVPKLTLTAQIEDNGFLWIKSAETENGTRLTPAQLMDFADGLKYFAQETANQEHAQLLVVDQCYWFRGKRGVSYVQYKGNTDGVVSVQQILKNGAIVANCAVEPFGYPVAGLKLMTKQPTVHVAED